MTPTTLRGDHPQSLGAEATLGTPNLAEGPQGLSAGRAREHWQPQGWLLPVASDGPEGTQGHVCGPLPQTPAWGHHRVTLRTGAGGCSTYLVMQIHHEWVLVGRVSGRVKHSWRRAGESVGTGLIYRDVRLLGEGRVQLGLILAQQGCQRSVASSPLTPGRGAAGPPRERNRAGVTPRQGAPQLRAGGPQAAQRQPSSHGTVPGQAPSLGGQPQHRLLRSPCTCPPLVSSAQEGPLLPISRARWTCFPATISPQAPPGAGGLPPAGISPAAPHSDQAPHHPAPRTFVGGGRGCCRVPPRNGAG